MKTEITHKLIGITALILTASFISTAVQAATVTIDSLTYETNEEDSTASVTDCPDNFTGAVTIPSSFTVDGTAYTVTDIGWNAFSGCSSLKEIILPDSLSSIGWYAFYCCTSLTEIVIPDSVTFIGRSAFSDCSSLNWIYFQSQTPPEVGSLVFFGCPSNMIIYYPLGVEVNWPTEWQGFVTKAWDPLTYEVIKDGTASVTDCPDNFTGAVTIPSSITVDGTAYTVTDIGWNAFSGCSSLKEIILPDSLSSIGWHAFYCCTSLTEIVIPDSVTFIGRSAFAYCDSLTGIYFQSQTPPEVGSLVFSGCPSNMIIYYPEGAEANWGTEWQGFATAPWDPVIDPIPEQPTLTCGTVSKNPETGEISFTLTFTGTLQESADGITWSDVSDAAKGTYTVTVRKNQNRFFRAIVK